MVFPTSSWCNIKAVDEDSCSTIQTMKMPRVCITLLLFAAAYPCSGQVLSASQYRDYLDRLDGAAQQWQTHIRSIGVEKMNVDYSTGKMIERERGAVLGNLKNLRAFIDKQRSNELLSVDILMEGSMGDASEPLSVLLLTLPSDQDRVKSLSTVQTNMVDLQLEIRKHIDAYADKLQSRAESCSK